MTQSDAALAVTIADSFLNWMCQSGNQLEFFSVQEAFCQWLADAGFEAVKGSYSLAVQVALVYLSRCLANPTYRRVIFGPEGGPTESTVLPIKAPELSDNETFWDCLREDNFKREYEAWRISNPPRASHLC
jgi:hypothetical protein